MSRHIIVGPPGCGKTTFSKDIVEEHQKQGTPLDQIAYMAFTKAAALEAAQRCGVTEGDTSDLWFRTIHSACYKLMGERSSRPGLMNGKLRKQFATEYGLDMSDEAGRVDEESLESLYANAMADRRDHDGDKYLRLYTLTRLCCRSVGDLDQAIKEQHPRTMSVEVVEPRAYRSFSEAYEQFKKREGVIDFVDMLARVVRGDCRPAPEFKVAVIDECQDLAPLMYAVAEKILFPAEDLFLVGDDMQAIYTFMMSNAQDFLKYRDGAKTIVLRQTHRFGKAIVDLAARIEHRVDDAHRQSREVLPLQGVEHEIREEWGFDPEEFAKIVGQHTGAVLHRHVAGCRELGRRMIQSGIPFYNERGANPLERTDERNGYMAWQALCNTGKLTHEQLVALLDVVPSRKAVEGETVTLVHHGAKKKYKEMVLPEPEAVIYQGEELQGALSAILLNAAQAKDPLWLSIQYREYYDLLISKGFDLVKGKPRIVISTVHGFKGREAHTIALFSEIFPKLIDQEDEHRVAYVGATRTKKNLWIVREPVCGDWTKEYEYPLSSDETVST